MATFSIGCLLDASNDMEAVAAAGNLEWAWTQWAMCCCEERGGHWWLMCGEHPDDGGRVTLHCIGCGADVDDYSGMPDSYEFVYGEIGGITVDAGVHDAADEFEIPVRARVRVEQYGPNMDMIYPEYDVFVDIDPA